MQRAHVVALGESLAAHQPARFEHRVREQEAVGGDEVDARVIGPAAEQRLQHARDRALARRDAARDADHVRHLRVQVAEERLGDDVQVTGRREAQVQQPRQRQVDVFDLAQLDRLVEPAQRVEVGLGERERRRRRAARLHSSRVKSTYGSSSDVRSVGSHEPRRYATQSARARPIGQLTPVPPRPQ